MRQVLPSKGIAFKKSVPPTAVALPSEVKSGCEAEKTEVGDARRADGGTHERRAGRQLAAGPPGWPPQAAPLAPCAPPSPASAAFFLAVLWPARWPAAFWSSSPRRRPCRPCRALLPKWPQRRCREARPRAGRAGLRRRAQVSKGPSKPRTTLRALQNSPASGLARVREPP